jgi:hypothetical protein
VDTRALAIPSASPSPKHTGRDGHCCETEGERGGPPDNTGRSVSVGDSEAGFATRRTTNATTATRLWSLNLSTAQFDPKWTSDVSQDPGSGTDGGLDGLGGPFVNTPNPYSNPGLFLYKACTGRDPHAY